MLEIGTRVEYCLASTDAIIRPLQGELGYITGVIDYGHRSIDHDGGALLYPAQYKYDIIWDNPGKFVAKWFWDTCVRAVPIEYTQSQEGDLDDDI